MLLNDVAIRRLCANDAKLYVSSVEVDGRWIRCDKPMIEPFSESVSGNGVISYGLSHAGYDLRLAEEGWIFNPYTEEVIDPKRFGDPAYRKKMLHELEVHEDHYECEKGGVGRWIRIPAHSYILACSVEYLRIPRGIKAHVIGKSTYARAGIVVNTTDLEPGWEGIPTLEIGNITPCPAKLYVGEGCCQVNFDILCAEPETSYADKNGVYQGQTGVTTSRVRG